jgi:phage N-6-adenine-methyltransferase
MVDLSVHFSSKTDMWSTPQNLFDSFDFTHGFNLDVCATSENTKCIRYFTPEIDGLKQTWGGVCWMNPPYGRNISKWVKKAYESVANGEAIKVVCLLPARTDTAWFHDYCIKGNVNFIRGRLKFGGCKNSAPFPSMIVIFER